MSLQGAPFENFLDISFRLNVLSHFLFLIQSGGGIGP